MEKIKSHKVLVYFIISVVLLFIVFVTALIVGKYSINVFQFFDCIFNPSSSNETNRIVIINTRLPRTIIAGLVGVALSISGLVYQEIFQNKLVSPDLLGVSSGASVGAAIAIICGLSGVWICGFSFVFGILAMLFTLFIAKIVQNDSSLTLVLAGIVVGGFMSAGISFIKFMADSDSQLGEITYWLLGSFQRSKLSDVYILAPITVICTMVIFVLRWRINVVALGQDECQTKGVNYKFHRTLLIILVTLLTASAVAFCGVVGWIGLVIPHIVRMLVGRNLAQSVPLTIMLGAIFMILCDIISRTFTFSEMPLSAVSGFLGTPIFAVVMYSKRENIYE